MVLQNSGKFRADKAGKSTVKTDKDGPREDNSEFRLRQLQEQDAIDEKYGFKRYTERAEREGFLINMHTTEILDDDKRLVSAVDYYFIEEDGTRFKVSLPYRPYFYVLTRKEHITEVSGFLNKKFPGHLASVEVVAKEDLDLPNHLIGLKQKYLKLSFMTVSDLMKVRQALMPAIRKNKEREKGRSHYADMLTTAIANSTELGVTRKTTDHMENIIDIREYDVPYHVRVSIDNKIFCGSWYSVLKLGDEPYRILKRDDLIERPDMIVLAYDIETTKLPLKFPDSQIDQIMMISYMIDGQGFLITNREIISADIDDFEYTPKPEFEGSFTVFNEPDEKALLIRFFDHIMDVRPHIFVSYNGDFFDWPFVEARAAIHGLDMKKEIGFSKNKEGVYCSRPSMHMDCLCWVKRDSYLPVGSQNLKAVAKAKLRYDPVEIDPEDMCRMAAEQPEVMSNYSVSDAVATYYLYMKYVHPFIFALCTIIPQEPDEVLRKGSGTLCESLLMVEAFHANIIFPNKQESEYNKLSTDGRVLDQETYVGGHVEALESGVFRADIPAQFRITPSAVKMLQDTVDHALKHAIVEEEKIPLETVTNFDQVAEDIKVKLQSLHDTPLRLENPVLYHLDVGAMYPNIILTNRLQPSAMVNEEDCAACDFNRPGAQCQRKMAWMWRGEVMPASRNEFQRIQQQLEQEKFPPQFPGGPHRAFHQLSKEEQAAAEKKRLSDYCRKAYKKTHFTRIEERTTTICQKENSFYVDTVRAFRDRRYEYKGLSKVAKRQVSEAVASGDAGAIKSAKNREILYDSLQLAHKCILNSFYGYVMRKGARWHSMEMAGIVCYTGANIIKRAREIIEQVGRPLELDTDGIWCILPASFPENYVIETTNPKKAKVTISYPNAVLNSMVKEHFTNDQYHDLVNPGTLEYKIKSENSIFFEVDGPYLAMVLPASKEEGKRLKKRYAVFNFDGSLAELKGFEVKRRGELQLVKIFQSSVFDAFLKGTTLEECYASVAKVANYWLDVLYSKGQSLQDSELFDLISENRSMSRKLEEYGGQKSTSISTAKRLAEFLGDQMVKDAGLACKFIISKKPEGSPVTERAVPLAIFQSDPAVKRHFLRKWLKDASITDIDIRDVLDWDYYIERLGGTIQKIITIPAAMQGVANPVPRVRHPDWLHKKMMEKTDVLKQRRITEMFTVKAKSPQVDSEGSTDEATSEASAPCSEDMFAESPDIEDIAGKAQTTVPARTPVVNTKRKRAPSPEKSPSQDWRQVLGPPPKLGTTKEERLAWLSYQKKKWALQAEQRAAQRASVEKRARTGGSDDQEDHLIPIAPMRAPRTQTIGGFLKRAQRNLLNTPWQILKVSDANQHGQMKVWALVGTELHQVKLVVPRIFYVNQRTPRDESKIWEKCNRTLPRARPVQYLYKVSVPEEVFREHRHELMADIATPEVEGVYETQVSLEFRVLMTLGCVCIVDRREASKMAISGVPDFFTLEQLQFRTVAQHPYLEQESGEFPLRRLYLYHHWSPNRNRAMFGLFLAPTKKALILVLDTVRTNQMPNMSTLYNNERNAKISRGYADSSLPPQDFYFEIRVVTDERQVFRSIQSALTSYRDEKKGPSLLAIQSVAGPSYLMSNIPELAEMPVMTIHGLVENESLYAALDWQRLGARSMVNHYLSSEKVIALTVEHCRYLHIPVGNLPADSALFGADLFYARHLVKNNFVLWCSNTDRPDLGGMEGDDNRLLTEVDESGGIDLNSPGCYSSVCIDLEIDSLAVNTLLQAHHIHDFEGTSASIAFDAMPQASLEDMVTGQGTVLPSYDETTLCAAAFRIIRSMVGVWLRDVSLHQNEFADMQIVHFYRWLRSPSALLYDPALRRTLHSLMKKMFLQLVAEFKRLGSIVVFANFNKIVLCTSKRTVEDAIGYVDFVSKSIRNKELFHSIQIMYQQCWEYLMWLDPSNHGGVRGELPEHLAGNSKGNADSGSHQTDEDENTYGVPEIVMNWNLAEHLPEAAGCQTNFSAVIAGYIMKIFMHLQENYESHSQSQPKRRLDTQSQTPRSLGVGSNKPTEEFAKELICGEMSQKLFQVTQKIHKKLPSQPLERFNPAFPRLPGSHLQLINPALEFVKAICRVLALDSAVVDEVTSLRRNLLRLINVGNFSDQAEWRDPCISFTLPEMICKNCNHSRDVDLCKDNFRGEENGRSVWKCPLCNSSYDNREIERLLIDTINRKSMAHVLQDLQCHKCLQIKMDNMSRYCTCAGEYHILLSKKDFGVHLKTFRSIAEHFDMPLLMEAVDWITEMNPNMVPIV